MPNERGQEFPACLNIRVDHHFHSHFDAGQLAGIELSLSKLIAKVQIMNQAVQDLVDAVAAQTGTIESMKTFIAGLEQQIKDALSGVTLPPDVQTALDGVFSGVKSNTTSIANAIDNDPST